MKVKNVGFSITSIYVWILNLTFFDFLDKFLSSALSPPPITSWSSTLNFGAKFVDPVVFNIELSYIAILLKPQMKCL